MTNEDMIPRRYLRMANARRKYRDIVAHIHQGGRVVVATHTHAKAYTRADDFILGRFSVYVRRGRGKDCIDYCSVQFWN